MQFPIRLRAAIGAGFKHLSASLVVAALAAVLVFGIWYPYPFDELAGGRGLFFILISVDVVCGPLLTMVVFSPRKPKGELIRDIGIIVVLQLTALVYGVYTMSLARPVYLAFEHDMFRVVRMTEIDTASLSKAPASLRHPGWFGPRLIGVRIAKPKDPDFLENVMMAANGVHPSFRPAYWLHYDDKRSDLIAMARTLDQLFKKYASKRNEISRAIVETGLNKNDLGYLPMNAGTRTDFVVLINLANGEPVGYLPLDGW